MSDENFLIKQGRMLAATEELEQISEFGKEFKTHIDVLNCVINDSIKPHLQIDV